MRLALAIAVVAVVVGVAVWWQWFYDPVESTVTRTPFRYGFELRNQSNQAIRDARLEVFAPIDIPGRQDVLTLSASTEFEEKRDEFGNVTLVFDIELLPPFGTKMVFIEGEAELWSPGLAVELTDATPYLQSDSKVQIADARIVAKAAEIAELSGDLIENTVRFVHTHVKDVGYLTEDRGAIYALTEAKGDCTEYMSLFTALSRANDTPTRKMAGFLVNPDGARLASSAYHNWAEYYDGRRWWLVDAQRGAINEAVERYLSFRVLNESSQFSTSQRFFASDPRLRVKLL